MDDGPDSPDGANVDPESSSDRDTGGNVDRDDPAGDSTAGSGADATDATPDADGDDGDDAATDATTDEPAGGDASADEGGVEDDPTDEGADADGVLGSTRRRLLALVGAGVVAGGGVLATGGADEVADLVRPDPKTAAALAERHAPDLHYGAAERWFPTDPRRYESTHENRTVVTGFDALDGYTREFAASGDPPAPTVFYNAVRVTERLDAVQYWFYFAFDQFSVNFHWHDWELLQVFLDRETGKPVLYDASAHSRKVPNNEYLDPERTDRVAVVAEVGSHSSALGVNARPRSFERFPSEGLLPDVTNQAIDVAQTALGVPTAYGLPRDEGAPLPYVVPELDGAPLYEHPQLPNVSREHLLPADLTVRGDDAGRPPSLPTRRFGRTLSPDDAGDHRYDLVPTTATDHIAAYTGPQLSFEFAVPRFAEDAVASHLTTAGVPQNQPRYADPVADVTDPGHRSALANRFPGVDPGGPASQVVGVLREATAGTGIAPENAGISLSAPPVEGVCLLESPDPTAIPTSRGFVFACNVGERDHRLTVNGPGLAPYAEEFTHGGGTTHVGVDGAVTVVPRASAVKVRADARQTPAGVRHLRVADDFAGGVYDGRPPGEDRFGVYVHRSGAYTAEIEDRDGDRGAFRVNPDPGDEEAVIEDPRTGKLSLVRYVRDYLAEGLAEARRFRGSDEVPADALAEAIDALAAATRAAERAVDRAEAGEAAATDERLTTVTARLDDVAAAVRANRGALSVRVVALLGRRIERLRTRIEQARSAPLK